MPKQLYTIKDWSGGMNNRKDPRDLSDNQGGFIENMSVDALGKIKSIGDMYLHKEGSDASTDLSQYIVALTAAIAGGYGFFYFESDHSKDADESLDATIGTDDSEFKFVRVSTNPGGQTSAPEGGSGL
tara:strand:- start:36 stop:419 length:384 start_codon:yes stop_codon:yes gene_type:complete